MPFRPSHRLPAAFVAIAIAPAVLLVWLGLRLYQQDQALEVQRIRERRETAADLIVARLQQALLNTEQGLTRETPAADALIVVFGPRGIEVRPKDGLLYYPVAPATERRTGPVFQHAEELEFQRQDSRRALAEYRALAVSGDAAARAEAHFRIARMLRKAGQTDAALNAYAQAESAGEGSIEGVPLSLLARWARCDLLSELGRTDELRAAAARLDRDLLSGIWHLDRHLWEFHTAEVSRWLGTRENPPAAQMALAAGVEWVWANQSDSGRHAFEAAGRPVTVLWRRAEAGLMALVAGPDYASTRWFASLPSLAAAHSVTVTVGNAPHTGRAYETARLAADTGLPWTVQTRTAQLDVELKQLAARRQPLFASIALVVLLLLAGGYFIARGITHDLALARQQSDFVAAVSHEFRTPLTSLRQFTEILIARNLPDDRRNTYYHAMARQTQRLQRLVEDLLDFGRMERGAVLYRMEPLPAGDVVRSAVEEFRQQMSGGWRIEFEEEDACLTIRGDREALARAIWNLLDNAVKYSKTCQTVWTEVGRHEDRVAIRVRDRGLGMPADEQKQVFRKFVRGSAAKAENIRGTGIGLSIVDQIVHAHAGEVRLESEAGVGTTFTILLPKETENGANSHCRG
jgi:signal transduction histidine kinase